MAARTPSPPILTVPQNTPFTSRPSTSHSTPTPTPSPFHSSNPFNSLSALPFFVNTLLPKTALARAPVKSKEPYQTAEIASSQLHPTLEAALHIMNSDLPSAHFLVRHMPAPPAVEGMLLHGILHRCEGDFNNARIWLRDVSDICLGWSPKKREEVKMEETVYEGTRLAGETEGLLDFVYGDGQVGSGEEEAKRLIDDIETFRRRDKRTGVDDDTEGDEIEERIRTELERVIEWCRKKFGEGKWEDASSAWVRPGEEVRKTGNDMVSGDKGYRKF